MKLSQDFNISTKGNNIPKPLRYWHEADISDDILEVIKDCNYEVRVISISTLKFRFWAIHLCFTQSQSKKIKKRTVSFNRHY